MMKSFRHLFVNTLLISAGLGCVLGLAVGLWSAIDGEGAGVMLARGSIMLAAVLILAFLFALILAHLVHRAFDGLHQSVRDLQASRWDLPSPTPGPGVFELLAGELQELGLQLEKQRHADEERHRTEMRQHRDEALLRFAQGVVREVQKPLAGVIGFVELASRQGDLPAQIQNYLKFIDQEARAGRDALDRILRYCRDEAHSTEALDINALLQECSRGISGTDEAKIQMDLNLSKHIPKIMASPGSLMQVFSTLLNNARDALMPEGGHIRVSSNLDAAGQVIVMVQDDGRGIPPEDQPKVFSPYFSSKGNLKGAGLNLALADRLIRQHGGQLDFSSSPGKGTVFFVKLPSAKLN